jgi:uncharacterized protein YkwD
MPLRFRSSGIAASLVALVALAACSESTTAPVGPDETAVPETAASGTAVTASQTGTASAVRPNLEVTGTTTTTVTGATYAAAGCGGTTVMLTADEKRSLDLHNAQRTRSGLVPFCVDQKLTNAARAHSQEMIDRDYFSHNSYDGTAFWVRINSFGYTGWTALAENIAWGSGTYGSPDAIFNSWMNSAGHKANIMNGNLRQIGIGVVMGTYLTYAGARMYTADFGTR